MILSPRLYHWAFYREQASTFDIQIDPVESDSVSPETKKVYETRKSSRRGTFVRSTYPDKTIHDKAQEEFPKIQCHPFDPNTITKEELLAMGINQYVATNLTRYVGSGGFFKTIKDLERIYGMDSTTLESIAACVVIPKEKSSIVSTVPALIEINSATEDDWKNLPGIGEVFARRIVQFRDKLGGFSSIDQVRETYSLPPEVFDKFAARLVINSEPHALDLNLATSEDLSAHPYITKRQAEAIINYRTHHGPFAQVGDVLNIYCLSKDWLNQMSPYLTCSPVLQSSPGPPAE